jgi:hypothetical protein
MEMNILIVKTVIIMRNFTRSKHLVISNQQSAFSGLRQKSPIDHLLIYQIF